jgi:hypothetical protein
MAEWAVSLVPLLRRVPLLRVLAIALLLLASVSCSLVERVVTWAVDCSKTEKCSQEGRCGTRFSGDFYSCYPTGTADCQQSTGCTTGGRCVYDPLRGRIDACVHPLTLGPPTSPCTERCKLFGQCAIDKGSCVASSDAECRASDYCLEHGRCQFQKNYLDSCVAGSVQDCATSTHCKEDGSCDWLPTESNCGPTTDAHCQQSAACTSHGRCKLQSLPYFGNSCVGP